MGTAKVRKTDALRRALKAAQGHICPYCGERLYRFAPKAHAVSVDHVVPLAHDGPDTLGNMLAAHAGCNGKKGDRMPTGCEIVWLLSVNTRMGVGPQQLPA